MNGFISFENKDYPIKLKEIINSPKNIYYIGSPIWDRPCLAVVGSRDCKENSKNTISRIISSLSKEIIIVSGLARGIDAAAHVAAIKNDKKTIAVLPCGIERIYPKENERIAKKIIEREGMIISEYPKRISPNKFSFIQRNRIITGLASAVLVAEAQMKSGSISAANTAIKQGKTIYAIPGSEGCDYLILNGAIPVLKASDICL